MIWENHHLHCRNVTSTQQDTRLNFKAFNFNFTKGESWSRPKGSQSCLCVCRISTPDLEETLILHGCPKNQSYAVSMPMHVPWHISNQHMCHINTKYFAYVANKWFLKTMMFLSNATYFFFKEYKVTDFFLISLYTNVKQCAALLTKCLWTLEWWKVMEGEVGMTFFYSTHVPWCPPNFA